MASVARDMTIASLIVLVTSGAIVAWGHLQPIMPLTKPIAVATGSPATVIVRGEARPAEANGNERRVVLLRLASYQPPARGTVQILVRSLRDAGQPIELGRFAVFPNTPFGPGSEASERTYQVPARTCPNEPGLGCTLDVELSVVPVAGEGAGAHMTIGGATIVWR